MMRTRPATLIPSIDRALHALLAVLSASLALALAGAVPAFAQAPWWGLDSTSAPANLPHRGEGQVVVTAANLGDAEVNGAAVPVTIVDQLPAGVSATAVEGGAGQGVPGDEGHEAALSCSLHPLVTCTFAKTLPPYERLWMRIIVQMEEPQEQPLENKVEVEGGDTPPRSLSKPLKVDEAPTPFGVESYELTPEREDGSRDDQAGSHPFQLTTTLDLNQTLAYYSSPTEHGIYPTAPALPRDLHFTLPPGLVGDASAVAQCSNTDFSATGKVNQCPADTAVGVASVTVNDPVPLDWAILTVPVFNLVPAPGEPARFGFEVEDVPVVLRTAVPAGGEYAVEVSVTEASQAAQLLSSQVTLWGVPGAPSHDQSRGWECLGDGWWVEHEPGRPCVAMNEQAPTAFLTLPTSCARAPVTTVGGESWPAGPARPGSVLEGEGTSYEFPSTLSGCGLLAFEPSIHVQPEVHAASTPTGLTVNVHVPQESLLEASGASESTVRDATVTLPEGVQASPGAAAGLLACSGIEVGLAPGRDESLKTLIENDNFSAGPSACPEASKIGTVTIDTPLLENALTGGVYLASQDTDPFRSPLVLYLLAEDPVSGVRVKLAGEVRLDLLTGQLTSEFRETPPLPFSNVTFNLFGGPRAAQSTPSLCGSYTTTASFVPWSGAQRAQRSTNPDEFVIEHGADGSACQYANPLTFSPGLSAGPTSSQAGAFTDFTLTIAHGDADQALTGVEVHLPAGAAALLSKLTPCQEPPTGREWDCGSESWIGKSTVNAGLGGEPIALPPGNVYLTTGYDGAPFGLLVATPAQAGPFNLGMVYVRSRIEVNPITAAVTITTDPGPGGDVLPTILKGVPVQLKSIDVTVERPEFELNPTNCDPTSITGEPMDTTATFRGSQNGSHGASAPYPVSNCATLPFAPVLSAAAVGHGSKAEGTTFTVTVRSGGVDGSGVAQAGIAKVDLQLPKQLSSRLPTLQKACVASVFEENPAACDEGSVIGHATIHTPIFKNPISGPAYLVSHGGAAFPDVEFVLQGEGITLVLDGKTDIKGEVTYSRFESTPDAPFTSFETVLPAGPHGVLTPNVAESKHFDLCGETLEMPTTIAGQNGAMIEQSTKVAVEGCAQVKSVKVRKLSRAQKLAAALKACRTKYRHNKAKRLTCEKAARARYAVKKAGGRTKQAGKAARGERAARNAARTSRGHG